MTKPSKSTSAFENRSIRRKFLAHYESDRGRLRTEIVRRHLALAVLKPSSAPSIRALDLGSGDGRDAIWLAQQGADVVALDIADEMNLEASARLSKTEGTKGPLRGSVSIKSGDHDSALAEFGPNSFDLVLSHGVLMYQERPEAFVEANLALVKPGGYLSLLTKNADAVPYRAWAEGGIAEASRLVDDTQTLGHLGVETRGYTIQDIADMAFAYGGTVRSWVGVRILTDTIPLDAELENFKQILNVEWKLARREPHRRIGALLHAIILKGVDLSLLPE